MRKRLIWLLYAAFAVVAFAACATRGNPEPVEPSRSFAGIVTEIGENFVTVEGQLDQNQPIGLFSFNTSGLPELRHGDQPYELTIGTPLRLTYVGTITESYPAGINVTDWQLVTE